MSAHKTLAGRFRVVREVGRGGMGVVYEGVDEPTGARVAVKRMLGRGDVDIARFTREAEILAELEHPGLVRHVAHGATEEGDPFLAMEWLEGEDLSARLLRGPLDEAAAVAVGERAADALGALHAHGLVHRDVKPSNIFLVGGSVDDAKLLDLGIARSVAATTRVTQTGASVGTPAYMSPEQVRGEEVDARADVFSLGCVLYECLAGFPPFRGQHAVAVLMKVLVDQPPRLDEGFPVGPALAALVARMLGKLPDDRPRHGGEVRDALAEIRRGEVDSVRSRRGRVTGAERRVMSLVMVGGVDAVATTTSPPGRDDLEDRASAAVAQHGGALQVLPGGAMLVTPTRPSAPTDQAACAARCALALATLPGSAPIAVVTGLAVVAGRVPVGEAIERAVRFVASGAARADRIRIDEASAALLDARFEIEGEGEGEDQWLLREREVADPARLLLGRPTPFVGRDRDLASLLATVDECAAEPVARAVLVTAAAGTGKSRLMRELAHVAVARLPKLEIFVARGDSLGAGSPLAMAGQIIRRAAAIEDGDAFDAKVAKLEARAARLLPEGRGVTVEILREIAGLHVPAAQASDALRAARRDPTLMGDAVRAAWERWLEAECATGPRAIVLEDLHWGDRPTVQLVDAALLNLADSPLFVVATARPEVHDLFPKLWAARNVTEVRLGPVGKSASERLVREVLGSAVTERRLAMVLQRAGGNPFLLEELIRAVAEGRADDTLPEGVLGMVQLRLDALSPDARRALRAASVFGETFSRGGVAALLGGDDAALSRALAELGAKELTAPHPGARAPGDEEHAFRHALVRDAAYAMLTDADRKAAHALAGEWLEAAGGRDPLVLAEHFDRGDAPARAIPCYQRAAEQALEAGDPAGAIQRAERAVACGAEGEVRGALDYVCAEALYWRGELAPSREKAEAAASRLPEGTPAWFQAVATLIKAAGQASDNDAAEAWGLRAAVLAAPPSAVDAQVVCVCQAVNQIIWVHRDAAVSALSARLDALAGDDPDQLGALAAAWVHQMRGLRCAITMRFGRARDHRTAAMAAFERAGARRLASMTQIFRAAGRAAIEPEQAFADLDASISAGERLGASYIVGLGRFMRAYTLLVTGRWAEAEATSREIADALRASPRVRAACLMYAANAAYRLGRWSAGKEAALEAAELYSSSLLRASMLAFAAQIDAGAGDLPGARALVGKVKQALAETPYRRVDDEHGTFVDYAFAGAFAAVGEDDEARTILRPCLIAIRAAADDLADPRERETLLSCPWPWRPTLELAERLGLTL